jgi:hypothetical protein
MSEQLKDLMKRAGEANKRKQQIEGEHKFFAWFENTFGIKTYENGTAKYGNPIAVVDNFIGFICNNLDEVSAEVHIKCKLCGESELCCIGVIKSLDELGKHLSLDKQGNYHFDCGNHKFELTSDANLSGLNNHKNLPKSNTDTNLFVS